MKSLFRIAWRLMWERKGVTLATIFALILPTALAIILLVVRHQTEGALRKDAGNFDLVVGAKGGSMQLVLSSLYHLGMPTGNILYDDFKKLSTDKRVKTAIPIGLGDNFEGYRIVGTSPDLFGVKKLSGEFIAPLSLGKSFQKDTFEAVIGAQAAKQSGLKVGDTFNGTHGLIQVPGAEVHTDFTYNVVGILEPVGSAVDRAIYVPISAVWKVHHAEESVHQVFRKSQPITQEVTAVLVQLHSAGLRLWMVDELRKEPNLMPAVPINEILSLSEIYLSPFQKLLLMVTGGVIIVSCIVILLSLYQAIERREKSLLTLRSLGAKRSELLRMLFYEIITLVMFGIAGGWLLGHGVVAALSSLIYQRTGLLFEAWKVVPGELTTLGGITALLLLIGLLPMILLYRKSAV